MTTEILSPYCCGGGSGDDAPLVMDTLIILGHSSLAVFAVAGLKNTN